MAAPREPGEPQPRPPLPEPPPRWTLERLRREYVQAVLRHTGGRRSETARILGIDRRTLYNWIRRMELEAEPEDG